MSTTTKIATDILENSEVFAFDGNSDAINECFRRHLRKLKKSGKGKTKKNGANVAARPTKLAFVIYFDNGVIEPKRSTACPAPPIASFNRLSVSATISPLVSTPPLMIPSPLPTLPPPPFITTTTTAITTAPPLLPFVIPPSSPAVVPHSPPSPPTADPQPLPSSPAVVPHSPPSPPTADPQPLPSSPVASPPTPRLPATTDKGHRICSISKEQELDWLIKLDNEHRNELLPLDDELNYLNADHLEIQEKVHEVIEDSDRCKMQLDAKTQQVDKQMQQLDEHKQQLDEQLQQVDVNMQELRDEKLMIKHDYILVDEKKKEAETEKKIIYINPIKSKTKLFRCAQFGLK